MSRENFGEIFIAFFVGFLVFIIVGSTYFTMKEAKQWSSDNLYNPGDVLYHKASLKRLVIVKDHYCTERYWVSDGEREFFVKEFELQEDPK